MNYAKVLSVIIAVVITFGMFWAIGVRASEIPWVESTSASSGIVYVEVNSEHTDISFVCRHLTAASLLESLSVSRSNSSPTPVVAAMLSKIDPFDKELNIGEWISTCSLDELDK